jgi:hypothetical protein
MATSKPKETTLTRLHLATFAAMLVLSGAGSALAAGDPPTNTPAAAPTAAPAAPAKPPKPNRDDQVVCKSQPEPGSRLGGKTVCMTRREWEQMSDDARDSRNHAPPQ